METGGVSKSMVSLLNVIDKKRFDVSLMLVSPHGAFMELLPDNIKLITNPVWSSLTSRFKGTLSLLKLKHPFLAIVHLLRLFLAKIDKSLSGRLIAILMPSVDYEFDLIVDYNGQHQLYYMVDKLKAKKKITFFHSDYFKWPYYYKADKKYFPKVDYIFTISDICAESIRSIFPNIRNKVKIMENISSYSLICELANQMDVTNEIDPNVASILTIGHLCEGKGTHWAIQAASILKKRGIIFHWYFIGKNLDENHYERMKSAFDVKDCITFLGIKVNPYPYIKAATIIAHPSMYEGKSIALDEVRLLCKPTVVTNFSTVTDQFTNRFNATICEMTPTSIADSIDELLKDEDLRTTYKNNLNNSRRDNSDQVNKLYELLNE